MQFLMQFLPLREENIKLQDTNFLSPFHYLEYFAVKTQ